MVGLSLVPPLYLWQPIKDSRGSWLRLKLTSRQVLAFNFSHVEKEFYEFNKQFHYCRTERKVIYLQVTASCKQSVTKYFTHQKINLYQAMHSTQ